jgi:putative zinc finger/helix-turn-helix YgiT family protein
MKSPITGKEMRLVKEPQQLTFRKEQFTVVYHYYLCEESGEHFTNDKLDTINTNQAYNQYREKYGIPFPDQIRAIRKKYNVSASKMSEILGFGPNTYRLYEAGDIPSISNGRLILSINQPEEFIRQVDASSHILTAKEVTKLREYARVIEQQERADIWYRTFVMNPTEFSGYKALNLEKIGNVISYLDKMELFKTKLNKLLFYVDFYMYQHVGYSITGIEYRAIPYGPVPKDYDHLYLKLQEESRISIVEVAFDNGNYGELIKSTLEVDNEALSETEVAVLDKVIDTFKWNTTKEIVEISHKEAAWKDNKDDRKIISYQKYAFGLNAFMEN